MTIRNNLKNLVTSKYRSFINNISENIGQKPRDFWKLLASRTKSRSSPGHLKDGQNDITDPTAKANLFNTFFHSIFGSWNHRELPTHTLTEDDDLHTIHIDQEDVIIALSQLDSSKAHSPDGIPTRILKDYAEEITPNLAEIFQLLPNQMHCPP